MHVLIGGLIAVALLYFWLIGHWFARVLTFLMLATLFGTLAVLWAHDYPHLQQAAACLVGIGMAWHVSSLPIHYHRHKAAPRVSRVQIIPPERWERKRVEPRLYR